MKKDDNILLAQQNHMKESLIKRYDIDSKFVDKVFEEVNKNSNVICSNYNLDSLNSNPVILYKIYLSICINHEFDKDRFDEIKYSNEYINNFVGRIVSQTIYSDLFESVFQMNNLINHPVVLSMLSMANLIKYRATLIDAPMLKKKNHIDYLPVFILIKEAMQSLESVLTLIAQRAFSQAMTIYRLYLEQIIIVMAIIKNPHLIKDYLLHQKLAERYSFDTQDEEILHLIEEKKIPARDIKSYLSYGWIEKMEGFSDLPKPRYSIKVMSKLSDTTNIYELYAQSTNYVHMNYLLTGINWTYVINQTIETLFATLVGIINNYKALDYRVKHGNDIVITVMTCIVYSTSISITS